MLCFIILSIPFICIMIKLLIFFLVRKFGKISYKDFSALGFAYDSNKDYFYTVKNAWQKNFGYSHFYDVMAPIFHMIIDTEPIKFYYDNKNWLITFWKGQYGMVTGAEVGIYNTRQLIVNKQTMYLPAEEKDMLNIDFILYRNRQLITKVNANHWWLAVFKLGMFSKPSELTMDINITFPNKDMLKAFVEAFKKKGYKDKDYSVIDNTFCFYYKRPKTHKVWTRGIISDFIRQSINKNNVKLYNKYLIDNVDYDNSSNNKVIMINDLIPDILKNTDNKDVEEGSDKIIKNIDSKNVILLHNDIYSNVGANKI